MTIFYCNTTDSWNILRYCRDRNVSRTSKSKIIKSRFSKLFLPALIAGFFGASFVPVASAQEKAMIVLDGSGSMWGQIEGEAKISIARRVLSDVLENVAPTVELGLMSYGHRRQGDCGDIELIVEPGANMAQTISDAADQISPLGKTPLADSVRQAAEFLRYTEEKATVILITDGIETCGVEICQAAADLEASGINFQINVIGFGLSAQEGQQLVCLAEETGGLYLAANDAAGLANALIQPLQEIAIVPPQEMVEAQPLILPDANIEAPDSVEIGRPFVTNWQGPGEQLDAIILVNPLLPEESRRALTFIRVANGDMAEQTVVTMAPVNPGTYELQYLWRDQRIVLARRNIEVLEASIWLKAPSTIAIGRPFTTVWAGPGARLDAIRIADLRVLGGDDNILRGKRLVVDDFANNRLTLEAPAEPGFYQLQYWSGDGREVLATREIEVLEAETSLSAALKVGIGSTFDVNWVGPGARMDYVELYNLEGRRIVAKRLVNGDFANQIVDLVAPAVPGAYELRYLNRTNNVVLATRMIDVAAIEVSVTGPASVAAGEVFSVNWQGPGARRDTIDIFSVESAKIVSRVRILRGDFAGKTLELTAPDVSGEYILRYMNVDNGAVLAEAFLSVR